MYENHDFHIPVMGTGFSADLPLKVGRYGVSSVVSLVDDRLLEQLRAYYSNKFGVEYVEIGLREDDGRARRVTAYLDFLHDQLAAQMEHLRTLDFSAGSDLCRYFELLPAGELRARYLAMLELPEGEEKRRQQRELRERIVPGTIDANIMTKIDRQYDARGQLRASQDSDALAALRGFAKSKGRSSIVFSAGLNTRLYGYTAEFDAFYPDASGSLLKQVILKVSDFRSAAIQGRFLAKRGVWVSEFRIEAGLNCGGHAFPADGQLIGVILEEFRVQREALATELFAVWSKTLEEKGRIVPAVRPDLRVTVQGGIGTAEEHRFLRERFGVEATGWASPWLLVPEAVTLDDDTRQRLLNARAEDIQLSWSSPLKVRFWNLVRSSSEDERRRRIADGRPGSACPKGFLAADREHSEVPLCLAAREYQKKELVKLRAGDTAPAIVEERMLAKSCICHELGGAIVSALGIDPDASASVCPGPNLANFRQIASFEQMFAHIYGRYDLLAGVDRPHVFVAELRLNIEFLRDELEDFARGLSDRKSAYFTKARENLRTGIEFYRVLALDMGPAGATFLRDLEATSIELGELSLAA